MIQIPIVILIVILNLIVIVTQILIVTLTVIVFLILILIVSVIVILIVIVIVTDSDLSRNRLCELPEELCQFISLETLSLYHNGMRSLSSGICNLQALTYLNIRYLHSGQTAVTADTHGPASLSWVLYYCCFLRRSSCIDFTLRSCLLAVRNLHISQLE